VPSSTTTTSTSLPGLPPPALLEGKKLLIKAKPENDAKRRLTLIARGDVTLGDGPGSADDPTQLGVEASLRIVSTAGAVDVTYSIAEPGTWRPLKRRKPEKGYKYSKGDPVASVVLKTDKQLKIVAKGAGLADLLGSNPDPVDVELRIGDQRWCMTFGDGAYVEGKKYLAKKTGLAPACPSGP